MLSNYLKVAIRQLLKNKTFSLINIFGLSVGVACCVLLTMFIQDEFSYEKHFADHERIYRICTSFQKDGNNDKLPRISPPIATELAQVLPEVEKGVRTVIPPNVTQLLVRYKEDEFYEKSGLVVDSTFFDMFNYPLIEGNPETVLDEPATVVISEDLSRKIFKGTNPLDELLIINMGGSSDTFRITGVIKKIASKSHTDASIFMSMRSEGIGAYVMREQTWAWNNFISGYLKLKPGTDIKSVEEKMAKLLEEHAGADLRGAGIVKELYLQPLDDIKLYSDFSNAFGDMGNGTITYIYILGSIGIFILLIACINFMNLTTAKAAQRAGEVGIRKSMGAHRSHLIRQFLGESFAIVAVSLILAIVLILVGLPVMNEITNKQLSLSGPNMVMIAIALLVVGTFTGLIAGSYPAFFLSGFEPARVLKSKNLSGDGSSLLRRGLVVFQFVITISLISAIFIIQQQLTFIRNMPLGFDGSGAIMVPLRTAEATRAVKVLERAYTNVPGVVNVSAASSLPSTPTFQDWIMYTEGSSYDKGSLCRIVFVDEDYFKTMGIELLEGRDVIFPADTFSYSSSRNKIILNESALKIYGLDRETAVGKSLYVDNDNEKRAQEIIGVIGDYHHNSLHVPIMPTMFALAPDNSDFQYLVASTEGGNYKAVTEQMRQIWESSILATPFDSQPLSESVAVQYQDDDRINTMMSISTALAIVISCMGLYGLSIFVAERKIKEIGIRKVLGASIPGIVGMLSKDFIKLVTISFIIAVPVSYYLMDKWLEGFAYKIEIGFAVFVLAGLVSFAIAWITIGFESVKAAMGNPVKALKSE